MGGKFVALKGEKGDEGPVADWWLYEDLVRPLVRVDSAVGQGSTFTVELRSSPAS